MSEFKKLKKIIVLFIGHKHKGRGILSEKDTFLTCDPLGLIQKSNGDKPYSLKWWCAGPNLWNELK